MTTPPNPPPTPRRHYRPMTALLCLALGGAIAIFVGVVNSHYPVRDWLFWRYLTVALLAAIWATSCASMGCFLVGRLTPPAGQPSAPPGPGELALAFPLGVLAFQLVMFVLGLAGCLGSVTFVLLPIAFLQVGGHRLFTALRRLVKTTVPARTLPELAVILFGAGGIGLLYFALLSPEPFSWDARWYHLPIAQHYALLGAVRPYPEGWWLASYPHSASLVYTWAFLLPGGILWDRLELCAHLELAVFLCTIASIPPLVRALVPGASGRGTWAAVFLFPGILLYDGNLHAGGDHIAALWCIPVALSLARVWRSWSVADAILFAAFVAAGILSKYSAWSFLLFPSSLFIGRGIWLAAARRRGGGGPARRPAVTQPILPALAACGATVLLLTTPHWLKNWLWYGDPLYPVFYRHLNVHPWSPEAPEAFRIFKSFTFPPRPGWDGVKDALINTVTFSFIPNDWPTYHRNVPVFGSLFTLTLLCLPFVRAGVRLWIAYAGVMVAMFVWYLSNHQDRLLQAWLPFMAAVTIAALGLMWRQRHVAVRALVALLVGAQIVWGGDVPFLPTHNLVHDSPLRLVSNFLASGFLQTPNRLRPYGLEGEVGASLPRDAHLLLHELNLESIGFDVLTVSDEWQGRISYATLQSPAAIHRELAGLGITHLVWNNESTSGWNALGSDLAFLGFALNYAEEPRAFHQLIAARFPNTPPPPGLNDRVAVWPCGGPYGAGLYRLGGLTVPEPGQPWANPESPIADLPTLARSAGALALDPGCAPALPDDVKALFHQPVRRGSLQLFVRKAAGR